jgi:hypothetical protein
MCAINRADFEQVNSTSAEHEQRFWEMWTNRVENSGRRMG